MKKTFLALALLTSALTSAQIRVEVTSLFSGINNTGARYKQEIAQILIFDTVTDMAQVICKDTILNYTLVDMNETTVTFTIQVSRIDEQGIVKVISNPPLKIEWEKQGLITIADSVGEYQEFALTPHKE